MLHRQIISRPVVVSDSSLKAPHLVGFPGAPCLHRLRSSMPTPDVRARSYDDDYDSYGRSGRKGRQGDTRRQRGGGGKSRRSDDDEAADWSDPGGDADLMGYSEEVSIPGMSGTGASSPSGASPSPSSSSGGGGTYGYDRGEQRQRQGGYGRGGGRGYGGRGGGGGGGERQWGGRQQQQQQAGDAESPESYGQAAEGGNFRRGGQWQGQGQGQGQGRRYGGGGRGDGGRGEGGGAGEGQRTYRGPRESLSPEALAARTAISEAVKAAPDWRAVAALLQEHGPAMDAEQIVGMLLKLARWGRPTSPSDSAAFESLVSSLYGWVSSMVAVLRPKQLSNCLWAIAKLELFNAELVGALAERGAAQMGNFGGFEASNAVWAFARLNYSPGEEWLNSFVYWTERRLPGFRPVELSNTIGSLARLGHVPPPTWMDAFTQAVAKQAADFNTLEAVNTLFGLASLGYGGGADPASWLGPLLGGGQGGRGGAAGAAGVAVAESLRVADLTRTTWALTQFEWEPPQTWLAAATKGFMRNLRYCLPSDLATLSYSLAYLKAAPSADQLNQLAQVLPRAWDKLSGDEVANVAMSLALWNYRPQSDRWLDELVLAVRAKLTGCSPDALAKVVSALPLLGSGYRLGQVVGEAQAILDAHAAQQAGAEGDAYAQQAQAEGEQQVASPV